MGGVTLGIPGIMQEWNVSLNDAVNGLISWIVLTLGVGVSLDSKLAIVLISNRISFGLQPPSISENDQSSYSFPSSPLRAQFGVRKHSPGQA